MSPFVSNHLEFDADDFQFIDPDEDLQVES